MKDKQDIKVGLIYNKYGNIYIRKRNNKYYWGIGDEGNEGGYMWEEISKLLYDELLKKGVYGLDVEYRGSDKILYEEDF